MLRTPEPHQRYTCHKTMELVGDHRHAQSLGPILACIAFAMTGTHADETQTGQISKRKESWRLRQRGVQFCKMSGIKGGYEEDAVGLTDRLRPTWVLLP